MKNSKLFAYSSGLFLFDEYGNQVNECSVYTEIDSMSDPLIAAWITHCNEYGFYPELVLSNKLEVA